MEFVYTYLSSLVLTRNFAYRNQAPFCFWNQLVMRVKFLVQVKNGRFDGVQTYDSLITRQTLYPQCQEAPEGGYLLNNDITHRYSTLVPGQPPADLISSY